MVKDVWGNLIPISDEFNGKKPATAKNPSAPQEKPYGNSGWFKELRTSQTAINNSSLPTRKPRGW